MSIAKSISEEQKALIQTWADEGVGLSEIQRRLADEMEVKVTYMETRFLLDDLGVKMPEDEKPKPADEPEATAESDEPVVEPDDEGAEEAEATEEPDAESAGSVTVAISELVRPGAMVSGSVTFAGGESADWWMDQMGRLGMDPRNPEFRPSESDMLAFQTELQEVAKKKGM